MGRILHCAAAVALVLLAAGLVGPVVAAGGDTVRRRVSGARTHTSISGRPGRFTGASGAQGPPSGVLGVVSDHLGAKVAASAGMEALRALPEVASAIAGMPRSLLGESPSPMGTQATEAQAAAAHAKRLAAFDARAAAAEAAVPLEYLKAHGGALAGHLAARRAAATSAVGDGRSAARRLADAACSNRGIATTGEEVEYFCDDQQVTQAQYNAILQAQATQRTFNNGGLNTTANATAGNSTSANSTLPIPGTIPILSATCEERVVAVATCACPFDYTGPTCATKRGRECNVTFSEVGYKECVEAGGSTFGGYDPKDDGTPPCIFLTDRTTLPFTLKCGFTKAQPPMCNGTEIPAATVTNNPGRAPFYGLTGCLEGTFEYWALADDGSFAMLKQPAGGLALRVRPYNFNQLSDTSGSKDVPVTPVALVRGAPVQVAYPAGDVPEGAQAGGRVTFRVSAGPDVRASELVLHPFDLQADIKAYVPPPPEEEDHTAEILLWTLLVLVLAVLAVVVWWRWFRTPPAASGKRPRHTKHE